MTPLNYNARALTQEARQSPRFHTDACLAQRVDAFCDDTPEPGCTCDGDTRVEDRVAETVHTAGIRLTHDEAAHMVEERVERLVTHDIECVVAASVSNPDALARRELELLEEAWEDIASRYDVQP